MRALLVSLLLVAPASHANRCATAATEFIEPALLSGPLHTVRPCADVVGHMARFELDTKFGVQTVDSVELLAIRIDELPSVEALERTNAGLLAARAAGAEAKERGDAVANVFRHPVESVKGLPRGVVRFFGQRIGKIGARLAKLGGRARDEITNADDHYGAFSTRPGVEPESGGKKNRTLAGKAGKEARKQALDYVSYNATRREWARRLGIDPYTTNPLIRERLDRLAWYAVAGKEAADLALATLPTSLLDVVDAARRVDEFVLDAPPDDVKRANRERLEALGCGGIEARRLVDRGPLSLPLQTRFVAALESVAAHGGCVDVVELAAEVRGEIEARYLVNALALLATHAPSISPLSDDPIRDAAARYERLPRRADGTLEIAAPLPPRRKLALAGTAVVLRTDDDAGRASIVLPLAVDRLEWTASTREFFDQPDFRVVDKTALVAGELTPTARRALVRRGWHVVERASRDFDDATGALAALKRAGPARS